MELIKARQAGFLAIALIALWSVPAFAQTDLSGRWSNVVHEDGSEYRIRGPAVGDYTGHPINEAARMRADAWMESRNTLPEFQCIPHGAAYWQNAGTIRILPIIDDVSKEVIGLNMDLSFYRVTRDVWLDGRSHPSRDARHTWTGFSTGEWNGATLTITTTHIKENRVSRSGIEHSDDVVVVEHIMPHGDRLTWITMINDPVYFEEPMIHSRTFVRNEGLNMGPYPCVGTVEILFEATEMPHWLPGQNPDLFDWAELHGVPVEAARGGARTLLPEFREQMQ